MLDNECAIAEGLPVWRAVRNHFHCLSNCSYPESHSQIEHPCAWLGDLLHCVQARDLRGITFVRKISCGTAFKKSHLAQLRDVPSHTGLALAEWLRGMCQRVECRMLI